MYTRTVLVHRDAHVTNMWIAKKGLESLDSQDAVTDVVASDLAG
jgi:hypothetical protein